MKIKHLIILLLMISWVLPYPTISAYSQEVHDFNRIWYNPADGFNKQGNGALVLAITYTNNTLRTIDTCSIEFYQDPFYFGITFEDELQRDSEGNIIEPKDGYFYLRKAVVMNYFPDDLKRLASKNLQYSTIQYNGDTWFRVHVPDFNKGYEWGTYDDMDIEETWYTWGNTNSVSFRQRAMLIKKTKDVLGSIEFDISHPSDHSGQIISINKTYLSNKGITKPVFELDKKTRIPFTENNTHYLIYPPHFSYIGVHEAISGTYNGSIPLQLQSTQDDGNYVSDIWANETHVLGSFENDGLRVYSFTGKILTLIDTIDDGGTYTGVCGNETIRYASCGADGLRAYSFNGTDLILLDTIDDGGYYYDACMHNNDIITPCGNVLRAYSFNGTDFSLLDEIDNSSDLYLTACSNDTYVVAVGGFSGIFSYTFNGSDFTLIDNQDDGGNYYGVFCNETYFFSSINMGGLRAYECNGTNLNLIADKPDVWSPGWEKAGGDTDEPYIYTTHTIDGIYVHTINGSNFVLKDLQDDTSPGSGYYECGFLYNDTFFTGLQTDGIFAYNLFEEFNTTRTIGVSTESNNFTFTPRHNKTSNITCIVLCCPVSNSTRGIIDVTNNTCGVQATSVNSFNALTNSTYWYDSANQDVYIGTINLTTSMIVNWTVNTSHGANFSIHIPQYLTVGDYLHMNGMIENSTGSPINGLIASTYVYHSNGSVAIGDSPHIKWNCTDGNYACTISTTVLIPGIYGVSINFTDPSTGIVFQFGDTLYLSHATPIGIHYDTTVFINFYNTKAGLGLPYETLQIYIDGVIQEDNIYHTYAGDIINLTIKDYYNTTLYTNNFTIDKDPYPIRLGLTFHEYDFANFNEEYYVIGFLKQGASRWFEKIIPSRGHEEFLLPTGNYTIRVYNADNSSYLSFNDTVNSSVGYTIDGYNLTQVIEGLSVITGQILELSGDLQNALQPDFVRILTNPPTIFSIFDMKGMMLDFRRICPPLIIQAETRNVTYDHDFISYELAPTNGTSQNGTILIKTDTLYLGGNSTYVNISYTNGTNILNESYVPSVVDLFGGDIWINASGDLFVRRVTIYQQGLKFEWDYWASSGHGPIPNRKGYHEATINVSNILNTTLYEVYVMVGLSNETSCDGSTVRVQDIENSGTYLDRADNFDVTETAVQFQITGSIPALTYRPFHIDYYEDVTDSYQYTAVERIVTEYHDGNFNGKPMKYFNVDWTNQISKTIRGELYVKIGFNVPTEIDTSTVIVKDLDNNQLLNGSEFIATPDYIRISHSALGDVLPGSGRSYRVYFNLETYPGMETKRLTLSTPFYDLYGLGITLHLIISLLALIPLGYGAYAWISCHSGKKSKVNEQKYVVILAIGVFVEFMVFFLSSIGI